MKTFDKSSYLSQVRRLRNLGLDALTKYSIKPKSIDFINHGENTTFKVTSRDGKKYLLRIHRPDYHTASALMEELNWLNKLAQAKQITAPRPLRAKNGEFLVDGRANGVPQSRNVSVLHWIDGKFLPGTLPLTDIYELGRLLALLHKRPPKTRYRHYWNAEGLIGTKPKFGSIDKLIGVTPDHQRKITAARKKTLKVIKAYERKYPRRLGLVHADLHFGNLLKTKNGLGAIDFDDCGYGFKAYDIAVPILSAEYTLGEKRQAHLPKMRAALIEGYRSLARFDKADVTLVDHLITARKIMMLGWLNARRDNPRLRKRLKINVRRVLSHIQKNSERRE